MTAESFVVPPEVRAAIDAHLDAVDLALLKGGVGRVNRAGIVRDLETQLLDMLRERCAGRAPTVEDVAGILAGMDPPEAYAQGRAGAAAPTSVPPPPPLPERKPRRKLPSHAVWGAGMMAVGFFALLVLVGAVSNGGRHGGSFGNVVLTLLAGTPVVLMIALASFLGASAWRQIAADRERYWGRPVAVVEMAAFPMLVFCAAPLLFLAMFLAGACLLAVHHLFDLQTTARRVLASF